MFKITLDFATAEDAILALATLRDAKLSPDTPAVKVTKPTPKDKPAETKPDAAAPGKSVTTDKPADGKPDAKDGPGAAPEKKELASSGSATAGAYEPVGALIKKLATTHRAQVLATLGEFGAANGKELKPEQYESFIEKLTAATSEDGLG